jgi:hypothetical protein
MPQKQSQFIDGWLQQLQAKHPNSARAEGTKPI